MVVSDFQLTEVGVLSTTLISVVPDVAPSLELALLENLIS